MRFHGKPYLFACKVRQWLLLAVGLISVFPFSIIEAAGPAPNLNAQQKVFTYLTQPGETLAVVAVHFGVEMDQIFSEEELPHQAILPTGTLLYIPNILQNTSSGVRLLPDSEMVYSKSASEFPTRQYIEEAGGYLSTYYQYLQQGGYSTGAEIIEKISVEYSIHPKLLLALLEHQTGSVFGKSLSEEAKRYPMGIVRSGVLGLSKQVALVITYLENGYYGWRNGKLLAVKLSDRTVLRLSPDLNCATVGLINFFSQNHKADTWEDALYGPNGFMATYERMFGDPWENAAGYEDLWSADVKQPVLQLPFDPGTVWSHTVGPHAPWGVSEVLGALDFGPPSSDLGCGWNENWVSAMAPGVVVRSHNGAVVVDMDGDKNEGTGWNIIYMHVSSIDRPEVGTEVQTGRRLGHPSCEGGAATGVHTHIVRKYNGEWVSVDGAIPFVIEGWRSVAGPYTHSGWLVRGTEVVRANLYGSAATRIQRDP